MGISAAAREYDEEAVRLAAGWTIWMELKSRSSRISPFTSTQRQMRRRTVWHRPIRLLRPSSGTSAPSVSFSGCADPTSDWPLRRNSYERTAAISPLPSPTQNSPISSRTMRIRTAMPSWCARRASRSGNISCCRAGWMSVSRRKRL